MILYLIRHGETDWNTVKRLQGATDIPLNENGEALARATCEGMKDIHLDLIFTSPLKRAYRTAELVRGERDIPIIKEERIREICFGDYEGLISRSEGYSIPDPDFKFFFTKTDRYHTPPNGEPISLLLKRTGEFLEELKSHTKLTIWYAYKEDGLYRLSSIIYSSVSDNLPLNMMLKPAPIVKFEANGYLGNGSKIYSIGPYIGSLPAEVNKIEWSYSFTEKEYVIEEN
jgi:hypothetical protein